MNRYGYLALTYVGLKLPLKVMRSNAGYYIGTEDESGPCSRESHEYYRTFDEAEDALKCRGWTQKETP
ncbi:hypothetical protein [Saezia sanguinis]|uniref:hypothetical protein n=1 Tax=Saezia sanguinis TaxID=1965230 RepID=UPI00304DCFA9